MKYCQYSLEMTGDDEVIRFLDKRVPRRYQQLGVVREIARAIETLFGTSVTTSVIVQRVHTVKQVHALQGTGPHPE